MPASPEPGTGDLNETGSWLNPPIIFSRSRCVSRFPWGAVVKVAGRTNRHHPQGPEKR